MQNDAPSSLVPGTLRRARALLPAISIALVGCGGSAATVRTASTPAVEGHQARIEQPEPRVAPVSAFETRASRRGTEPPPLNARVDVPGTGASMRAPNGAVLMPVGAGFVDRDGRFQILVAVANGPAERLDQLAGSIGAGAQELESEDVTVGGRPARLVVDRQEAGGVAIERVWMLVRDGNHALATLGAYPANADDRVRTVVRDSIRSTEWDSNVAVDAERAAGFRLSAPEGLVADPQVVNGLIYVQPGSSLAPSSGRPAMVLLPLPITIPAAERASHCDALLRMAGPVADEVVVQRAIITTDTMQGCEVFGREQIPEPRPGGPTELATYAALVFVGEGAYLVAGFVDAAQRDAWTPRFSAATRTVRRVDR
jgi:hypothetical protein